jgi:hypothetical protein
LRGQQSDGGSIGFFKGWFFAVQRVVAEKQAGRCGGLRGRESAPGP